MARYHLNPETGDPGLCRARRGSCPYGGPAVHYGSAEEARVAYEAQQREQGDSFTTPLRSSADLYRVVERGSSEEKIALLREPRVAVDNPAVVAQLLDDADASVREAAERALGRPSSSSAGSPQLFQVDEEAQKTFRRSVSSAVAGVGLHLGLSMFDSLQGPKAEAYFAVVRAAEGGDQESTAHALAVAKEIEQQRQTLLRAAAAAEDGTRRGRRSAEELSAMARGLSETLDLINFSLLDPTGPVDPEEARVRWLSEEEAEAVVPCDSRHEQRVALRGFCPKCGGV